MVDSQVNHKFYKKMVKNQKSKGFHTQAQEKQPKALSSLKQLWGDPFTEAKLELFSFIASKMKPFFKKTANRQCIYILYIPYIYADLKNLITSLL